MRPCIAMCVGHMANYHHDQLASQDEDKCSKQRNIAMVSEMIHTASLVHDDILDHAETRRGKESVNVRWDIKRSELQRRSSKILEEGSTKHLLEVGNLYQSFTILGLGPVSVVHYTGPGSSIKQHTPN